MDASIREAVAEVVKRQIDTGIDVINDGEQGRSQYATYVKERLTGYEGESKVQVWERLDDRDFPEYAEVRPKGSQLMPQPVCTGPIAWRDFDAVQQDIDNLKAATSGARPEEVFMTSASPGVIASFLRNAYYPDHESYMRALANVMKDEYKAIVDSGLILQIDCPDLAMTRPSQWAHLTTEAFLEVVELHVDIINQALAGLPEDRMRLALAKEKSQKVVVGYILRHSPAWIEFINIARTLGKPLVMRMNLNQQSSGSKWHVHKQLMN